MTAVVVLCACPDEISAERIGTTLVEERLAACVNRIAGMVSTFRWQGSVCTQHEQLLLIKTTRDRFAAVRDRTLALHPYELPEIIALDIADAHAPYLDWIAAQTSG